MAILAHIALTIITVSTVLLVWNSVIYKNKEHGFPIIWIFSTVVKDIRIFEKKEGALLMQMEYWCKDNLNGKWRHCQHGYFVFRQKTDAMAFKLRWL